MPAISCKPRLCPCLSAVLLYQNLGLPKRAYIPAGHCAPILLSRQLDFMAERGWQSTALSSVVERCKCGDVAEQNEFCITFDDGYVSVHRVAFPALRDRDMTATVYVAAGSIGGSTDWDERLARRAEPIMDSEQIRELADNGFEIGSHTLSHPRLTALSDKSLKRELLDSKLRLEDITGKEVKSLSYPYGHYDQRVIDACIEAGYESAVCRKLATVPRAANPFEIPRISVRWNTIGAVLLRNIGHGYKEREHND